METISKTIHVLTIAIVTMEIVAKLETLEPLVAPSLHLGCYSLILKSFSFLGHSVQLLYSYHSSVNGILQDLNCNRSTVYVILW